MRVDEACEAYLRDLEARNLSRSTCEGYRSLFRKLQAFAAQEGIESLGDLNRAALRTWREGWTWTASTQRQYLGQLKAFFGFAQSEGWIAESPARGIKQPKSDAVPTMPLSVDEVRDLLHAANQKPREQALLLLLRYSGLAIRDAVTLERTAIQSDGELVLRRAKSGELVTVVLPGEVILALDAVADPPRRHFFWTGESLAETAVKYWRKRLQAVADMAGVKGFHPHRMRDTFAVELLLAGVAIQDVSTLLGHSSVQTTERHYAPWNQARRNRLSKLVREVHRQDPILPEFTPKKPAGAVRATPTEAGLATHHVPKPTRRLCVG